MPDEMTPKYKADWPCLTSEEKRRWRFDRWRARALRLLNGDASPCRAILRPLR
jgi:hypothetical protein